MSPRCAVPRRSQRWLLAGVLSGLLCARMYASASTYSRRVWQMEDGLPHNIVQSLAQTRDGYLWVGTREGLARFDGLRFQTTGLPPEVRHASVFCLLEGPEGSLWVGAEDAGLFRLHDGQCTRLPAPNGTMEYSVYGLHRSGEEVWIASSAGVLKWSGRTLHRQADYRNLVESLCVDTSGGVWLAGDGLRRLNGIATNYAVRTGALPREVRRAYCDRDGTFWLATGNRGLTRLDGGVATYHHKAEGPAGFVSVMFRDGAGEFWVGSYSGLSRFVDGGFVNEGEPEAPSYQVYAITEDREGSVWVGSEEGLTRFTPMAFKTYTKQDGLTLNRVVTVCASRDGSIWVGLHGGGLNHFFDGHFVPVGKTEGLSSDYAMAMCEGQDGSLWVGTDYGSTLNRLKAGLITQYGREQGYATAVTTALVEDGDGTLWAGTRDGLFALRDGQFRCYLVADGLSHDKINALCLKQDGGVWIGTGHGLTRWSDGRFTNLSAHIPELRTTILSLHEDAEGALWIGTQSEGLLRLRADTVRAFSSRHGLFSDSIYSVLEDQRGNLWLNSSRGIFRVRMKEFDDVAAGRRAGVNSIAYGKADGILSSGQYREVTQPAACQGADGRLWFRTTQGVTVVDPQRIATNEQPPPVAIEAVIADRKPLAEARERILVPKGRGELEIQYTALSLRAPEKNRFRYRLEGVDPDWVEAGSRRSAYYNKVKPGEYRFDVIASNNDGVWNTAGATLDIEIEPHFWETAWFLATCTMLSIAGIVSLAAWVTRSRMRRQLERLEQQHAIERERTRIARDMHDELGAKLTRISFQGATARRSLGNPAEVGPQIEQMSQTARELVSSLDEIVWAVDPENDSLENLANYICRHASAFFESSPIACEFAIPPNLPPVRLASDVRHHVFLATKEALTNVLKHSRAARVRIGLAAQVDEFEIVIADDGVGLAATRHDGVTSGNSARAGHGLANMRERLSAIQGRAEITDPGKGTHVRFIVPVHAAAAAGVTSIHPTDPGADRSSY